MVSRRKETNLPKDRPVRFYKIVALTFLFITLLLLGSIVFMSSKRATITITSKEKPIKSTTAVEVSSEPQPERSKVVKGMVTSTQIITTSTFSPTGEKKVPAKATGEITIRNDSGSPQPLVETTRFLSENEVLFRLQNDVEIPANSTTTAKIKADKEGEQGNIEPGRFTIPGLSSARQEVVYGTSNEPMTGGSRSVGAISKSDIEQAQEKLRKEIKQKAKNMFKTGQTKRNLKVSLSETSFQTESKIGEEVDNFDMRTEATVVGAAYDKSKIKELANQSLMKKAVDDTEIVKSSDKEPQVKFDSYDEENNTAILTVSIRGTSSLNPDSKQLNKVMFFGKTEQEVRRYLLSLEHVHSVDVEFSPAWIDTVPHVSDHVNVVVKKVK